MSNLSKLIVCLLFISSACGFGLVGRRPTSICSSVVKQYRQGQLGVTTRFAKKDGEDNKEDWDGDFDYEKNWPKESSSSPDPATSWNAPLDDFDLDTPKLGIDIGKQLKPLTEEEAAELKAAATELINDAVASQLDDIDRMRKDMNKQIEKSKKMMAVASDLNAQRESSKLMNKIDKITDDFLSSTKATRESTKLAARADQAMEGKGLEMGTWGVIDGVTVVSSAGGATSGASSLLGSVQSNIATGGQSEDEEITSTESRIVIVADPSQDDVAKQILPSFTEKLEEAIPGVDIKIIKPTDAMPLGCDDAACLLVFCTSLSERSSFNNIIDRALRKTIQADGKVGKPPTQLVGVSTVGTERLDKFPYSMDLFNRGKLEKRRQIEEGFVTTVQQRYTEPPLDYTICKFGDISNKKQSEFQLSPGDVLDGSTSVETAAEVLLQAVAYQPAARNATLCATGNLPASEKDSSVLFWNEKFLPVDGPEIYRMEDVEDSLLYEELVEYVKEWAMLLADTGKGLTTPITIMPSTLPSPNPMIEGVQDRTGVKILFLPTNTGTNYMSKEEERQRERQTGGSTTTTSAIANKNLGKDGGIEIVVEITTQNQMRLRLKRCNYPDNVVIKEISEKSIVKRFEEAITSWKRNID